MTYEEKRQRLELLKMGCVCTLLIISIIGQVCGCQRSDVAIKRIVELEAVVHEVAEQNACCPIGE